MRTPLDVTAKAEWLRSRPPRGVALVLVLAFLVLITGLVLAFFSSVTTELTSARSAADETNTKQLADSAVQTVIGSITTATTSTRPQAPQGSVYAWASQPGMIRTYDSSGKPAGYYKLYSSDNMVITTAQIGNAAFDSTKNPFVDLASTSSAASSDWKTNPALFTDLNAPSLDSSGVLNYPIVDPSANGLVQGFSLNNAPGYTGSNPSSSNDPAPMPVKWIYMLRDGTLTAPSGVNGTGKIANWTTAAAAMQPSATNPIVGRLAFWTDDETSKVNINTAGEGTYWDTPHFNSSVLASGAVTVATASQFPDYAYAAFQPAEYEFQRYPGHPAQVALSTVFSGLLGKDMASITPRLVWGGSQGGTTWAGGATATIDLSKANRKPLYASVDELLFSATATPRTVNVVASQPSSIPLTNTQLSQARFFITANSRAPEVNLFNKPRVCMWPISEGLATNPTSPFTTSYDRLIAFCSTLRGASPYRFYFQRGDSQSPTHDATIPDNKSRLYPYLQGFMSQAVPGFGASFTSKYAADSDQILTEIFDYIRCTNLSDPNLGGLPPAGTWGKGVNQFANYQNTFAVPPSAEIYCGQVTPIQIGSTMGFGRYYTIKDVSMVFACTGDGKDGPMPPAPAAGTIYQQSNDTTANVNSTTYNPTLAGTPLTTTQRRFQVALLLNYFLPSPGQLKCGPDMLVRISNLDQIKVSGAVNIDGGSLFPTPPTASGWVGKLMASGYSGYNPVDAVLKVRYPFIQHRAPFYYRSTYASATNGRIIYPFVSKAFTLPAGGTLALASAATLKIELFQAKAAYDDKDASLSATYKAPGAPTYNTITLDPTNLIQTINITIPAGTFPQPTLATANNVYALPAAQSPQGAWGFDGRIASPYTGAVQGSAIVAQSGATVYDTVRTISVSSGDPRLVAANNSVPATLYDGVASYSSASQSYHFFIDNVPPVGGQFGKLVPGIGGIGLSGLVPPGTELNYCKYGDFDGPLTRVGSGAFINKPDEGDSMDLGSGGTSSIPYYGYNESTTKNLNLYTPNRLMPSPGMLGSLSTGVKRNRPWQTLLFRPQPGHPNAAVPTTGPPYTTVPDYLIMDLFWMPIVEPYAISEPFSTAGKINPNYQLAPFSFAATGQSPYITRSTAMVSLLKNNKIAARPTNVDQADATTSFRLDINPSETLKQFQAKFASGDIFRSATQICDMDLVPVKDPTGAAQTWSASWGNTFWQANANTGDNVRERPYTNLYACMTTKSNTYRVHYRVQALKKVPTTAAAQWDESNDQVLSESRGSSVIERYVDANDSSLPDFATSATANLDTYYKFRVVTNKRFAP